MKIKTKLQLIIICNILLLVGIVSVTLFWKKQADRQSKQQALVIELNMGIFERARLREEYFLYRQDRSKEQFLLIHKQIGGLLERMLMTFTGLEEKVFLNNMTGFHTKIGGFFDQLVRLDQSAMVHTATTQALRERIASQMLVNAHSMYREGLRLLNATNEKTVYQDNLFHLYSNIVFGLLALFIVSFAVIIIRSITNPLAMLHKGTEIIAEGNLDYKTNIRTHDEIGRLSNAFDVMTENLKKIMVSRDKLSQEIEMRKRTEEALRESEEKYRSILENIEEGYFEVDIPGNFTFFNDSQCRILGYSRDEMMGMNNRQYMDKESAQKVYQAFNRIYTTGEPYRSFDWKIIRKDGTRKYIESSVSLKRNSKGERIGFRGVDRDITERKQAEEALRENENRLRTIVEGTQALLASVDANGYFTYTNDATAKAVGYARSEELIGKSYLHFIHPEDRQQVLDTFINQVNTHQPSNMQEFRIIDTEGKVKWFSFLSTLLIKDGQFIGQSGVAQDITERKRAEEERGKLIKELQEAAAKIKTLNRMLPICSSCKKIRDDKGYWNQIEVYIRDHSETEFTHGICPECMKKLYPDFVDEEK